MQSQFDIPILSTDQMIDVDRLMIEEYKVALIQIMENAGRNLAELARRMLGGDVIGSRIVVLCGAGNNGSGGLVAARHLQNWGAEISPVLATDTGKLKEVPARQWHILQNMGLKSDDRSDLKNVELIIDALIGYGLSNNPRPPVAGWIEKANKAGLPILSLDVPSGLDATSGIPGDPCIRAEATLTLALPKSGLLTPRAAGYVGELYLGDISVPPGLYRQLGLEVPNLFGENSIIKIC